MSAISGGSEMWGFPKHRFPATIRWDYHGDRLTQATTHRGKFAVGLDMKLPEFMAGHKVVEVDWKSGPGKVIGRPRWMYKQSTFRQDVLMNSTTRRGIPQPTASRSGTIHTTGRCPTSTASNRR